MEPSPGNTALPWPQLRSARSFGLEVQPRSGPMHRGRGDIVVEDLGGKVIWREEGRWQEGPLAGIPFHNSTAWEVTNDQRGIRLSHLRRGDRQPTFLVRMIPAGDSRWISEAPHLCGPDRYTAWLTAEAQHLTLGWEMDGPEDGYHLVLRITTDPNPDPTDA